MSNPSPKQLAKRMTDQGIANVPRDSIDQDVWDEAVAMYQADHEDPQPVRERNARAAVAVENEQAPDEPPSLLPEQPEDPEAMHARLDAESRARGDRM